MSHPPLLHRQRRCIGRIQILEGNLGLTIMNVIRFSPPTFLEERVQAVHLLHTVLVHGLKAVCTQQQDGVVVARIGLHIE